MGPGHQVNDVYVRNTPLKPHHTAVLHWPHRERKSSSSSPYEDEVCCASDADGFGDANFLLFSY